MALTHQIEQVVQRCLVIGGGTGQTGKHQALPLPMALAAQLLRARLVRAPPCTSSW